MRSSIKKIAIAVFALLIVIVTAISLLIPSPLSVGVATKVNCNTAALSRTIINQQWFAAFYRHTDSSFMLDNYTYVITKKLANAAVVLIKSKDYSYNSNIALIPLTTDSTIIEWTTQAATSGNPLEKIASYFKAQALHANMEKVLHQSKKFFENPENIYGYNIRRTTLSDTLIISAKQLSKAYPAVSEMYTLVQKIQQYITTHGAAITSYPMLNVNNTDSGFVTMIGIPTTKELPSEGIFSTRHLVPMKDKILTTEVKGGTATIQQAYRQIELYIDDRSLGTPVIPFEYMITDRSKEQDTTKWITKIYYPIIR